MVKLGVLLGGGEEEEGRCIFEGIDQADAQDECPKSCK